MDRLGWGGKDKVEGGQRVYVVEDWIGWSGEGRRRFESRGKDKVGVGRKGKDWSGEGRIMLEWRGKDKVEVEREG